MKRYIRTKDGKLIDTEPFYVPPKSNELTWSKYQKTVLRLEQDIRTGNAKEADTIEELIDFEKDLTTKKFNDCLITDNVVTEFDVKRIIELYTKQGNDYILVAKKENGEWRVI